MRRFADLSVFARLALAFGAVAMLLALLAGGSLHLLDRIRAQTRRYTELAAPRLEAIDQLESEALYLAVAVRAYMIWPVEVRRLECERQASRLRGALARLERVRSDPDSAERYVPIRALTESYLARADALVESVRTGRTNREEQTRLGVAREALLLPLRDISTTEHERTAAEISDIAAAQERTRQLLVAVALAVTAVFAATALLATRAISKPALALVEATRRVGAGDWAAGAALAPEPGDVRPRRDELAELTRAFGRMSVALRDREEQLAAQNEELQSQAEEIQAQNEELQSQAEEIQAQNEELLGHNEELAAQGDELRRAKAALVDADRRKNEFLAMLSHELRNPLAPIQNALHLLGARSDEDRSTRARGVIARQVRHLARLVEDLLDITRISRGKVELRRENVDFGAVVSHAAEDNASILEAAGVSLEVRPSAGRLPVYADPTRLAQVVENLLQNAAKFTPRGGRVTVSLERIAPDRAALRVLDTGIGISPDVHERLFEPFMQGELSLARTRGGLGLGLALVKGLVELHGGTVTASSEGPGRGAELTVELPLATGLLMVAPVASAPAARQRILLIEDNVDGAETLRDVLSMAGHSVELAFDGTSGLERARELRPDAIFCDVGLPDLDGYEVARRMRANPALERTLLVALTGYALPEDQRRAVNSGFDAHLAKPATLDEIEALLAGAVQRVAARS